MSSRPLDPAGADEGISRLRHCMRLLHDAMCREARDPFHDTICGLISLLAERVVEPLCLYAGLKLLFEACVQTAYYRLQGLGAEEALERVRRRSRSAASFSATMIRRLPGVHGSRKKWLLRVYLRLGDYTHPTARLYTRGLGHVDYDVAVEVLDACYYLMLLTGIAAHDVRGAEECGLEKSLRLLRRHHKV